jgi:superfamily II DNA or RNA helicase
MTTTAIRPLRDYQSACISSTLRLATAGFRGYYSLPTGTGKTRVITGLVEHYSRLGRVLVIAHRTELIDQAADALRSDIPGLDVGVCMAERNHYYAQVVVGSIQTLSSSRLGQVIDANPTLLFTREDEDTQITAVIFDECHHLTLDNSYSSLVNQVAAAYPECVFLGCTATPFRSDKASMLDVLPTCTFSRSIPEMIDAGWLCPITWKPLKLPIDLAHVKVSMSSEGKDYNAAEVTELYSPQSAYIAEKVKSLVENRPTVVFAASVEHASQLMQAFWHVGVMCSMLDATTPREERKQRLSAWKRGDVQVMVNVAVLTEGFDYVPQLPNLEGLAAVVVARPTMSPSLYLQMIGRGTRLKPGTYKDCLVIDVCGNANLLDTKQILVPKVMPTVSEEEIDAFNEGQEQETRKKARKKGIRDSTPYTVRINDGDQGSWLAWGQKNGVYYSDIDYGVIIVLLADPTGSGLWYPLVLRAQKRFAYTHESLVEHALPLSECMQHVNLLVATSGNRRRLDKDNIGRQAPPTDKQLKVLNKSTRVIAEEQGWTKGEVGLALSWQFIRVTVAALQRALKEGTLCPDD